VLLCPWGKSLNAISHLGAQAVYLLWWPSLTKDMQTEQCWSGMTDTEHSITSSSNKEEGSISNLILVIVLFLH